MNFNDNTIAAISTPLGPGAISIVRISGSMALDILTKLFIQKTPAALKSHTVYYGYIKYKGQILDEVLVTLMLSPNSYTKEDVVEISCHGGNVCAESVLRSVIDSGAMLATPGEFTKRAFLNGRINLTQAESVIDIINATSNTAKHMAISILTGGLGSKVTNIRNNILSCIAALEVAIDYPEEGYFSNAQQILEEINNSLISINDIINASANYETIKQGVFVAVVGRPNVGKSSLLNALLNEDRAIVTNIPGTTRDTISAHLSIGHVPINLIDTAGIRQTTDKIEIIGQQRTNEAIQKADLVLAVFDISDNISPIDIDIIKSAAQKKLLIVGNKLDLGQIADTKWLTDYGKVIKISVEQNIGIEELKTAITDYYPETDIKSEIVMANMRHVECLQKTINFLSFAKQSIDLNQSEEFVSLDLTSAYTSLGEVLGEEITEDIIDKIFSEFCLGK